MYLANQRLAMVYGLFRPLSEGEEMPKMCGLVTGSKGDVIYVNPMLVRLLRPGSPGNTLIVFDDNHSTVVALPTDQVRAALDRALNETG
jgi:hypothetical protein